MSNDQIALHTRWMIRRDESEVMEIENASFENVWTADDFIRCLRQRNCIGMVAECDEPEYSGLVIGYMVYELMQTRIHLLNFAVHPKFRRAGVGQRLVEKLKKKLSHERRTRICLEVRERNVPAQLFFKSQGFRAVSIIRDYYEDTDEDAILFQHRMPSPVLDAVEESSASGSNESQEAFR